MLIVSRTSNTNTYEIFNYLKQQLSRKLSGNKNRCRLYVVCAIVVALHLRAFRMGLYLISDIIFNQVVILLFYFFRVDSDNLFSRKMK